MKSEVAVYKLINNKAFDLAIKLHGTMEDLRKFAKNMWPNLVDADKAAFHNKEENFYEFLNKDESVRITLTAAGYEIVQVCVVPLSDFKQEAVQWTAFNNTGTNN